MQNLEVPLEAEVFHTVIDFGATTMQFFVAKVRG